MSQATGLLLILATIVFSLMAISRPMWAFALWMLMWSLEQLLQTFLPFLLSNGLYFNAYVAIIVAIAAMKSMARTDSNFSAYFNGTTICVLLLYLLGLLGVVWTPQREYAMNQVIWLGPYIITAVFFAPHLIRNISDITELRWMLMIGGVIIAGAMLFNPNLSFYGDRASVNFGSGDRGNPLELAQLGATITVVAALSRDSGTRGMLFTLRIFAVILGLGIALKSGTRGQVIAAFLVTAAFYPISRSRQGIAQGFITMIGLGILAITMVLAIRIFVTGENLGRWSLFSLTSGSVGRLHLVQDYFFAYLGNPAAWPLGFGTMAFSSEVPQAGVMFVENLFAEALFEQGLFGFALMMFVLCNTTRYVVFMIRNPLDEQQRNNAIVVGGLLVMSFLIAAKSYNLWTGFSFYYLCIVATKLGVVARRDFALNPEEYGEFDEYEEYESYDDHELPEDPGHGQELPDGEYPHPA